MLGMKLSDDDEVKAKLDVLDEIKALLDSRLVDKMKPKQEVAAQLDVEPQAEEEEKEAEIDPNDKEELKKIYAKLLG